MKFIKNSIYLEKNKALVISDLHIGLDQAITKKGILIPPDHYKRQKKELLRIRNILDKNGKDLKRIIVNGDFVHDFSRITKKTEKEIDDFIHSFGVYQLEFVKGNHDNIIKTFMAEKGYVLHDMWSEGENLIVHGNNMVGPEFYEKSKRLIIGHQHPAVSFNHNERVEKYKCFLVGKFKGCELVVMPSFHEMTIGCDPVNEEILSPYIDSESDFNVFVISDKVYDFGRLEF